MSYVRFLEADLYIFDHVDGYTTCCACWLGDGAEGAFDVRWPLNDWPAFLAHLNAHKAAGHRVPDWLVEDITRAATHHPGEPT